MRRSLPEARFRDVCLAPRGLSSLEAQARRGRYGSNDILDVAEHPWRAIARDTVRDPMLWFLAGVSALYALVGQRTESLTLLVAIVPLVVIDFILHRRTQASTAGLEGRLAARAITMRDGAPVEIPAVDLVPGDLVIVRAGTPFPADGVVVGGEDLQADESALTGEAFPVRKQPPDPAAVADGAGGDVTVCDESWGFAGTRLLTGEATVRVAFTGAETIYGDIVRSATGVARARTPLQTAIGRLVSVLMVAAVIVCVIVALVRLRQGFGWLDALVSAVTLAAAALPEEFPVVFTVFLGVGVYRLARRQALVRRAVSVENIGRVTCICSDKTGTITEGRLSLTEAIAGTGSRRELLRFAALASRPETGDPIDAAVAEAAQAANAAPDGHRVLATFPFTEHRKRETAVVWDGDGRRLAATKGAPEVVLALTELTPAERKAWEGRVATLAAGSSKVLACAWRPIEAPEAAGAPAEPQAGYRLAGILTFDDPVRTGVVTAVSACREAGIRTVMVTGDHPLAARAVARAIGLGGGTPTVITGDELEAAGIFEDRTLADVDVIARATPSQKLRLVRALQEAGEVVAVTGDGVNDVPALQAADVGVAMGDRATRSAREVAAIVLLDDNFRTIVRAIAEGRLLFENLRASFQYLLTIHIPLVLAAALIPLAGYPLLFLPAHIVWLELIIHPTSLLVFQGRSRDDTIPRSRPRRSTRVFSTREWVAIACTGSLLTALVVSAYVRSVDATGEIEHGRTVALAVLTLASALISATLGRLRTISGAVVAAATVVGSAALIQSTQTAAVLGLTPLHVDDWAIAAAGALGAAAILPIIEGLRRRSGPRDLP
jgi:Ca2+-transporting ATPase